MARTFNPIAPAVAAAAVLLALCLPLYADNTDQTGNEAPEIKFGETVLNGGPITGSSPALKANMFS